MMAKLNYLIHNLTSKYALGLTIQHATLTPDQIFDTLRKEILKIDPAISVEDFRTNFPKLAEKLRENDPEFSALVDQHFWELLMK